VRKNRNGPTGMVELIFLPDRGLLREESAGVVGRGGPPAGSAGELVRGEGRVR